MEQNTIDFVKEHAQAGEVKMQLRLAQMYMDGTGVEQDYQKAAQWYAKAADEGNVGGISSLAALYQMGWGVEKDTTKALELYCKAGEMGDDHSQLTAAKMLIDGDEVEKDTTRGAAMLVPLVERDEPIVDAEAYLGLLYMNGIGVEKDPVKGFDLLDKASEHGMQAATVMLEQMKTEDIIPSAELGNPSAQLLLGTRYMNGIGVERNFKKAAELYEKAAEAGYAGAQFNIGLLYEQGIARKHDYAEAASWYKKAADQGHPNANRALLRVEKLKAIEDYQTGGKKPKKAATPTAQPTESASAPDQPSSQEAKTEGSDNSGCSFVIIVIGVIGSLLMAL